MRLATFVIGWATILLIVGWARFLGQPSLLLPPLVQAAPTSLTVVIDSNKDQVDVLIGDGICAMADGFCSLRAAVQETNIWPGMDTIIVPSGTYTLTIGTSSVEPSAAVGDLDLMDDIRLIGAGSDLTIIDGGQLDRVFDSPCPSAELCEGKVPIIYIEEITIQNGFAYQGGGVANDGAYLSLARSVIRNNRSYGQGGGGLYNHTGVLTVTASQIISNAILSSGYGSGAGGGVYNWRGASWLIDSEIAGNTAYSGGGVFNYESGQVGITGTTIALNNAEENGGGLYNRGEITVDRTLFVSNTAVSGAGVYGMSGIMRIVNSTIHHNQALVSGGGVYGAHYTVAYSTLTDNQPVNVAGGLVTGSGTIIANEYGHNCADSSIWVSAGYNIIASADCGIGDPTDQVDIAPQLAPLADNGGPTWSRALLVDSPAVDRVAYGVNGCGREIRVDQRGEWRPAVGSCDIGAFERLGYQGFIPLVAQP